MAAPGFFSSFAALAAHLDALGLFRMRPELRALRAVLDRLAPAIVADGRPKAVIQVAGTNGKGSTSAFLASLAAAHGLRAGLFTSPHFVSFRERIRLNNTPAPEEVLLASANEIMAAGGEVLTYFEFVTALAARVFTARAVDVAVMETGLGGSFDAVTALPADVVAYTPISLDHCHILGNTVAAVASDKAGAMRPGKAVFSAPQTREGLRALEEAATARGCPFTLASPVDANVALRLQGEHQRVNAGLALAVWRHLASANGLPHSEERERAAFASAFIAGRMQYVPPSPEHGHPALLLDGAHNAHGMAALGKALAHKEIAPSAVIFSCLADKNPGEMATHLRVLATGPVFVPPIPDNPRALPPEEVARAVGLAAVPTASMEEALRLAARHTAERLAEETAEHPERHPVLVCGSLYMLGDFFRLRPDCLEG